MAIKTVTWTSSTFIDCAGIVLCGSANSMPIYLSLPDGLALNSPSGVPRSTVPATLTKVIAVPTASLTGCGAATYTYTFTYDDALLVGAATLTSANILGVKCQGVGTDLIDDKIHEEVLGIYGQIRYEDFFTAPLDISVAANRMITSADEDDAFWPDRSFLIVNANTFRSMLWSAHMRMTLQVEAHPLGIWTYGIDYRLDSGPWLYIQEAQYGPYSGNTNLPWTIDWTLQGILGPGDDTLLEIAAHVTATVAGPLTIATQFRHYAAIEGHLI